MSTQHAVNSANHNTISRRVKFGATLEDLEGRVLLSAVHHAQFHRAAHVRVVPVHHMKVLVHAKPLSHARVLTPTGTTPSQRPHSRNSTKAIAAAIINVQPTITIQPAINVQPNVSGGTASTQSASNTSANTSPTTPASTGTQATSHGSGSGGITSSTSGKWWLAAGGQNPSSSQSHESTSS